MIAIATVTFWCIEIVPGWHAEHRREQIAGRAADLPPALVPRAHASRSTTRPRTAAGTSRSAVGIAPSEWLTRYVQVSTIGNSLRQASRLSASWCSLYVRRSKQRSRGKQRRGGVVKDPALRRLAQRQCEELVDVLAHRLHARTRPVGAPDASCRRFPPGAGNNRAASTAGSRTSRGRRSDDAGRRRRRHPSRAAVRRARAGSSASESRPPHRPRPSDRQAAARAGKHGRTGMDRHRNAGRLAPAHRAPRASGSSS